MALDMTPAGLAQASACYCFTKDVAQRVKNYLWSVISGSNLTPAELAAASACYCYDAKSAKMVLISLLCDQANDAGNQALVTCTGEFLADAAKCYCFDHATAERVKIRLMVELAQLSSLTPSELAQRAACYCMDDKKVPLYLLCNPVVVPEPPPPADGGVEPPPEERRTFVVISAFNHNYGLQGNLFSISAAVYGSPTVVAERALIGSVQIFEGDIPRAPVSYTTYFDNYIWTQWGPYFFIWQGEFFRYDLWSPRTITVRYVNNGILTPGWPNAESVPLLLDTPGTWFNNPSTLQVDAVALAAFDAILASPTGGLLNQVAVNFWAWSDYGILNSNLGIQCMGGLVVTFTWAGGRSVFVRHANASSPVGRYYYWAGTHIVDDLTLS